MKYLSCLLLTLFVGCAESKLWVVKRGEVIGVSHFQEGGDALTSPGLKLLWNSRIIRCSSCTGTGTYRRG